MAKSSILIGCSSLAGIIDRQPLHLIGGQPRGDAAHTMVDVVVAPAIGEGGKLSFEILRVLAGDRRGLDRAAGSDAVTGYAGRQSAGAITLGYQIFDFDADIGRDG